MKRVLLIACVLALSAAAVAATVKGAPENRQSSPAPGGASVPAVTAPAEAPPQSPRPETATAESPHAQAPADAKHGEAALAGHEAGEAERAESPWATVARLFNFALLAGILAYLLRSPFGAFLESRRVQVRKDLTDAAATKESAARQLAEIDRRLEALPADLEALRQRGTQEIAAEQARIREAAEAERQRMLENARRDIGRRAQVAERRLVTLVATLAVNAATLRLRRRITDEDQRRLVDRYLEQVRTETMGS